MRALSLCCVVLLCSCPAPPPPNELSLTSPLARVDVVVKPFSFVVRGADGAAVLTSSGAPRATVDTPTWEAQIVPGWDDYRAGEAPWTSAGDAKLVSHSATEAVLEFPLGDGTTRLTLKLDGARVRVENTVTRGATRFNKSALAFALPVDEHFFGLGERFASFDHRGFSLYSWAEEGALGQGENTPPARDNPYPNGPSMTYFPVPFFLSSNGYGLHVDTNHRSELHLGSEDPGTWRAAVNALTVNLTVYVSPEPVKVLDAFTADTGRPVVPAPWVWGPRRRIGRGTRVDGGLEYELMREKQLPLTGIDDAVHFLPALSHVGIESDLQAWTSRAHQLGYKVMAYNNPYLATEHPNSIADYAYGADAGFFVKNPGGEPSTSFLISGAPLTITMIDFTNPGAAAWYRGLLQRTVDLGYDGWMHDFGEYVPRTGRFFDGRRGDEVHNEYPKLSAMQARAVLQAALPDDHLFFVRAGYTGSQAFAPAVWGGDAETSFDETQGIPSTIRSGLNLALSGVPYWGSDGTGFKCLGNSPRDKEVYVRWLELMAVSPIMMDQNACANPVQGAQTKWTLWSDEETQDLWRHYAGLHTRLQPYFMTLAREAHASGMPVMRPPFLFFPKRSETWALEDAFFLGPALYTAPVLRRGVTQREVWFPPGARYVDWETRDVFAPDTKFTLDAPLEKLPLYLVENQLVPMLDPAVQTLAPASEPGVVTAASKADVLDVRVALGPGGSASLTLADGTQLRARWTQDQGHAGFVEAPSLDTCDHCFVGADTEVHVVGAKSANSTLQFDALELTATGPARRVRWHVVRLP